jgi:hypothetical protein
MSIPKAEAANLNRVDVLALIWRGLQQFLIALAAAQFKPPITVSLKDADGDLVRGFTVVGDGKVQPAGRASSADTQAYVLPLVATARDAGGREAILKLDGQLVERVEFLN